MPQLSTYRNPRVQQKMDHIHYLTGIIVHVVQKLEFRLTNLITLKEIVQKVRSNKKILNMTDNEINTWINNQTEKKFMILLNKPFGSICQKAYKIGVLDNNECELISKIVERRNTLIHWFFRIIDFQLQDKLLIKNLNNEIKKLENFLLETREWYAYIKEKTRKYREENLN
ncbi:hypothetical protein NPA07_03140 [Mycoplasmopsis caviae]|uniref:Uncharacterized protein n=1 Tax=Mycoplasmopsis caviae TaxID=55603 RepID=A0A3P8MDX4_9BACT|nr:hypothetical protein [Mycoplasmopsis caviae]UUD34792.1 hypothetical protein NPA07_03140 [Mycoplasmopsis caviae]VDR42350.1 Uncharacterised protein [Mycoplasmopsis caviae]